MTSYLLSLIAASLLVTMHYKEYFSLKLLAVGNVLLGLSFLLIIDQPVIGPLMIWHLSMLTVAWIFWVSGVKAARDDDIPFVFYGVVYIGFLLTSSWLHYDGNNELGIFILLTLVMAIILGEAFYKEWRKWRENQMAVLYFVIAFLGFCSYWVFSHVPFAEWMSNLSIAGSLITNIMMLCLIIERSHRIIEKTALIDSLTGAYNRKYFIKHLEGVLDSVRRDKEGFCIAMIGIDDFRTINFAQGHRFGDKVLRIFKEIVDKNLRHYDVFARYDSEKFLFFFKEKDLEKGYYILDRILIDLRLYKWEEDDDLMVTFSGSIMGINERCKTLEPLEVIDALERQLAIAKEQGKNRIVKKENPLN